MEPVMGFEPATDHLRSDCSTTELHRLVKKIIYETAALLLIYTGLYRFSLSHLSHETIALPLSYTD